MIQLKSSFKGCFKDNPFYYKVKVHTWLRNTYSIAVYGKVFFSSELNKKGINGLFPFSGRSDLKGAFKTNIKPFQAV